MSRRYSQILKGALLKTAEDNYIKHLTSLENNNSKRAKGGEVSRTSSPRATGGIRPFGITEASGVLGITIKYPVESSVLIEKLVGAQRFTRTIPPADAPKYLESPKFFKPARVSLFTADGSRVYKQSNVTKLYNLHYGGKTHTCPFGSKAPTEKFEDAKLELRDSLSQGLSKYSRVSISPESE